MNARCKGLLIPVVKMVKAAKRVHFPEMPSYLLEVMVVNRLPAVMGEYATKSWPVTFPVLVADILYLLPTWLEQSSWIFPVASRRH